MGVVICGSLQAVQGAATFFYLASAFFHFLFIVSFLSVCHLGPVSETTFECTTEQVNIYTEKPVNSYKRNENYWCGWYKLPSHIHNHAGAKGDILSTKVKFLFGCMATEKNTVQHSPASMQHARNGTSIATAFLLLVGCLASQQHASVFQGQICSILHTVTQR